MKRRIATILLAWTCAIAAIAQNYAGMSGLINVPTGCMNAEGDAQLGAYFLNKAATPDAFSYNTYDAFMNITPFWFVEIGYTITLFKNEKGRYDNKDRNFSVKLAPIRETKYVPAIAIGAQDVVGTGLHWREKNSGNSYFSNIYIAATKHFKLGGQTLGATLAYRYCGSKYNEKWQGVIGGVTYRPSFAPDARAVVEYTGHEVNVGIDYLLFRHFLLQAFLTDGKHFSCGITYRVNLF